MIGNVPVDYELQYKSVKRINLRIHRDGRVCVSASRYVSLRQIEGFLLQNGDFILETLEKFRQMREAGDGMSVGKHREYQDGDVLYLAGEPYTLRVVQGSRETVETVGQELKLTQKDVSDAERRKRMVEKYLTGRCREAVEACSQKVYPYFERMGVSWPEIRIRSMVSRWGSCHPTKGVLTFARQLVEVPLPCLEYVVVHEFSHFIHPNHSADFHNFLTEVMPDWKQRKDLLNSRTWISRENER